MPPITRSRVRQALPALDRNARIAVGDIVFDLRHSLDTPHRGWPFFTYQVLDIHPEQGWLVLLGLFHVARRHTIAVWQKSSDYAKVTDTRVAGLYREGLPRVRSWELPMQFTGLF